MSVVVESDCIRRDTLALCEIGNRFAGTPGEVEARNFIMTRFAEVGLTSIRSKPFEVATYRPLTARCELVGTAGQTGLACVGLQFTAAAEVTAPALDLGQPEDLEALEQTIGNAGGIDGRIVVFESSYPYLFAERLVAEGAAGLVVVSNAPDGHICHLNGMMYPALAAQPNGTRLAIPGVTVERQAAEKLRGYLTTDNCRLRVVHEAEYEIVRTSNIVGELQAVGSDEQVVIGGHYDSQLEGVGASDNAAGIASVIEIARHLVDRKFHRSIVFAAFADEEGGFRGATQYCRDHAGTLDRIVGMVNVDAPGWSAQRSLHADPAIRNFALEAGASVDWIPDEEVEASVFPGSDHNPFIDAGVPACFFWRHPPRHPYYHTAGDRPELLNFSIAADTATVAAATIARLASDEELDLGRSRPGRRWLDLRPETARQTAHDG